MFKSPETPREPMEFLSCSWSVSALQISKALAPPPPPQNNPSAARIILEDISAEFDSAASISGNPFSFASSETPLLVMQRIMSHSQEVSPRTSGRLSHSGPLNGGSVSDMKKEDVRAQNAQLHATISVAGVAAAITAIAAATAALSAAGKDEQMAKTDMVVASAATLVAAQCVEAMGVSASSWLQLSALLSMSSRLATYDIDSSFSY